MRLQPILLSQEHIENPYISAPGRIIQKHTSFTMNSDLETPIRSSEIYESSSQLSEQKKKIGVTVRKPIIHMKNEPKVTSQNQSKLLPSVRGSMSGGIYFDKQYLNSVTNEGIQKKYMNIQDDLDHYTICTDSAQSRNLK